MKKLIALLLAITLVLSMCACSSGEQAAQPAAEADVAAEATQEIAEAVEATVDPLEEDRAYFEGIGEVEVDEGILTVSITVPASLAKGEITQQSLDADAGTKYVSAKLNDDGSVTYKMTRAQHTAMLAELDAAIDEAIQSFVNDESTAFTKIEHNDDCTAFDITLSTSTVGMVESISALGLYMVGGIYQAFAKGETTDIVLNYYGPDGALIQTNSSADLKN